MLLFLDNVARDSEDLVQRRELVAADVLGKWQRHVVQALKVVFRPGVWLEQEYLRLSIVLLDISRHGIRVKLVERVDKGREPEFGCLVLLLSDDEAGFTHVNKRVILLICISYQSLGGGK